MLPAGSFALLALATLLVGQLVHASPFALYAIGGGIRCNLNTNDGTYGEEDSYDAIQHYDPGGSNRFNSWTSGGEPMSVPRFGFGSAVVIDGTGQQHIFVVGGWNSVVEFLFAPDLFLILTSLFTYSRMGV